MTQLDVVTGFLGAGKTTFLARYLTWLQKKGVCACVIENEFGTAGVDGALLSARGAHVREISGGCVCCTLKVTLHDLLRELSRSYERILLEPSGLFCGDDLMDILNSPDCTTDAGMWTGLVDPLALPLMNTEDQAVLQSELFEAGSVVFSKAQFCGADDLRTARNWLDTALAKPAPGIWDQPWDNLDEDKWFPALQKAGFVHRPHARRLFDHATLFQSATFRPGVRYTKTELTERLRRVLADGGDSVLRIKGTLPAPEGTWHANAAPGCLTLDLVQGETAPALNVIGRALRRGKIREWLGEEK